MSDKENPGSAPAIQCSIVALLAACCVSCDPGDAAHEPDAKLATIQCTADEVPTRIGGASGEPQFSIIGPGAFVDDTVLIVTDRDTREHHLISTSGEVRKTFGRRGDGPGEFQRTDDIAQDGDSIAIYDSRLHRVSWYSTSGEPMDAARVPESWPVLGWHAPLLGKYMTRVFPIAGTSLQDQVVRDTVKVIVYDLVESDSVVLDTVPGTDRFFSTRGGYSAFVVPLGRQVSHAHAGSWIVVSDGSPDFTMWHVESGARDAFSLPDRSQAVTSELREMVEVAMAAGRAPDARSELVQQIPHPDRTPSYGPITGDAMGHVWIPVYSAPGEEGAEYVVVDSAGSVVQHSTWADRFRVIAASSRAIAGWTTDEYDVPEILIYRRHCRTN